MNCARMRFAALGLIVSLAGCSTSSKPDMPPPARGSDASAQTPAKPAIKTPTRDTQPAPIEPALTKSAPTKSAPTKPAPTKSALTEPARSDAAEPDTTPPTPSVAEPVAEPATPVMDPETAARIDAWLAQLTSAQDEARRDVIQSLDQVGDQSIARAAAALATGSEASRRACASYLVGRVGPRHTGAIKDLIAALDSDDEALRHRAFQALERLPAVTLQPAASGIAAILKDPAEPSEYRVRAARALSGIQSQAQAVVPVLEQVALADPDLLVRRAAFAALTETATPVASEQFFLKILPSDAPLEMRVLAAKWLGRTASSDEGLNGLVTALNDSEAAVRKEASTSLVAIGKPAVRPLVAATADSSPLQTRRYAIYTLGLLGPLAVDALPALRELTKDSDPEVHQLAAAAIRLIERSREE